MTRPHSLFGKSQGTHKGVIPVPHDKFKYVQCKYTAPRTLIKCKELRTNEQMTKNRGLCEQHAILTKICSEQGQLENELLKLEVEQNSPVKYEKAVRLGNHITHAQFLTEKSDWRGEVADMLNVASVLDPVDNPLIYTTTVSEKELILAKLVALRKHESKLKEMRERNEEKARRRMQQLGVNGEVFMKEIVAGLPEKLDDDPMTNNILKAHESTIKLNMEMNEKVEAVGNRKENLPACSFVWEVDGKQKKCTDNALPSTQLCNKHILASSEQKLFIPCKICHAPAIDMGHQLPVCPDHLNARLNNISSPGGTSRLYRAQPKKPAPAWHTYDGNSPTIVNQVTLDARIEEEEKPTMDKTSLTTSLPNIQKSTVARKKNSDGSMVKPNEWNQKLDPFMAAIYGTGPTQSSNTRKRSVLNDAHSMTCARVRPFHPKEFDISRPPSHRHLQQARAPRPTMMQMGGMNDEQSQSLATATATGTLHSQSASTCSISSISSISSSIPLSSPSIPIPSSIQHPHRIIRPSNERPSRPYVKPFIPADGEKESTRPPPYHFPPPSTSTSQQEALAKMYGKTPAFAPNMKKEQERRLQPIPSVSRQPVNRASFPLGKAQSAAQFARTLASDQSSSSSGIPSVPSKPSLFSSRMTSSTTPSSIGWSPMASSSRLSHLAPTRPTPHIKSLERESLISKKPLPTQSVSSGWGGHGGHSSFHFKPAGGGGGGGGSRSGGGAQLPVRQAITDEKKSLALDRPSMEVPRVSEKTLPIPSSSSQSPSKTTSNTSLPTLSFKEGKETPLASPLSTPPILSLEKAQPSTSMESEKSERKTVCPAIRFDQPFDDIDDEDDDDDDFEEEL